MASKQVRLDDGTYRRVTALQREGETISEAIDRLIRPPPLTELAGVLTDEQAERLREAIAEQERVDAGSSTDVVGRMRDREPE